MFLPGYARHPADRSPADLAAPIGPGYRAVARAAAPTPGLFRAKALPPGQPRAEGGARPVADGAGWSSAGFSIRGWQCPGRLPSAGWPRVSPVRWRALLHAGAVNVPAR